MPKVVVFASAQDRRLATATTELLDGRPRNPVEIIIGIPYQGKAATLEVSDHGVGSIVEVLCEELGLGEYLEMAAHGAVRNVTLDDLLVFVGKA